MLAAFRDVDRDRLVAIHRSFLDESCRKIGKAMMLGPVRGLP
jgi:hypothetical protein